MVFSHLIFIYAFLPLLMILYYVRRNNAWRRGVLLAFSLVFYAWGEPVYVLLMVGSAALNYLFGICIGASETDRGKKLAVVGSIDDVSFVKQIRQETEEFVALIQKYRNNH